MSIRDILRACVLTPMGQLFSDDEAWGYPALFHGPPGSSKTSTMNALANMCRYTHPAEKGQLVCPFENVKPGARGEGAFGCTPVPRERADGEIVLDFPAPTTIVEKFEHGVGFLLVDELNTAPPALQPPLLGLVQERELGVHKFGPRVRVFGATNTVDEAAGGWDIAPAVANRLCHFDWHDPKIEDWTQWLLGGATNDTTEIIDLDVEEQSTLVTWEQGAWARACGLVAGYMRARPEMFRQQPSSNDPQASRAWPSPRTWEYATRGMASAEVHGLSKSDRLTMVSAAVGATAASDLLKWEREQDLPDPALFLDGKVKFNHNPQRLDRTQAVLSACAALVKPESCQNRQARAAALWTFLGEISESAADLGAPVVGTLWKAKLVGMKEARPVLASMEAVVNAIPSRR